MAVLEAYSLFEVNEYIKRVIALNFDEPIWIECEIGQISEVRGQVYLDLIEKEQTNHTIRAQAQAVIWYKEYLFIKKKLGDLSNAILNEGVKVKIKAIIDYHEKYGLKLVISDIDPSYSLGMFELAKQKIIERLRREDLIHKNGLTALPKIIKKIAVISSSRAAGYQDFTEQLSSNPYGYAFKCDLYPAAMQGMKTERDVVDQLTRIGLKQDFYDIVIIIRGGGSKMDLSSFDNYNIAVAISKMKIPVITGIGHDIDETITDLVSHTVLKTPTAVADFIIDYNAQVESIILQIENNIGFIASSIINRYKFELGQFQNLLIQRPTELISSKLQSIKFIEAQIKQLPQAIIEKFNTRLHFYEELIELSNPKSILDRGFAIIHQENKTITSKASLDRKKNILITMKDGEIKAEIKG